MISIYYIAVLTCPAKGPYALYGFLAARNTDSFEKWTTTHRIRGNAYAPTTPIRRANSSYTRLPDFASSQFP
jgi:hypothetical protein